VLFLSTIFAKDLYCSVCSGNVPAGLGRVHAVRLRMYIQTYKNKQVPKNLSRILAENMPIKVDYFGIKTPKSTSAGGSGPRPPNRFND